MKNRIMGFVVLLVIVSACSSGNLKVEIDKYTPTVKGMDTIKAALIIDGDMKERVYTVTMDAKCFNKGKRGLGYIKGKVRVKVNIGKSMDKIFRNSFSSLFGKIDVFNEINEMPDSGYDIIIVPDFSCDSSYDRDQALNREEVGTWPSITDYEGWVRRNCFNIVAKIIFEIEILDGKSGEMMDFYRKEFSCRSNTCFGNCSEDIEDYDMIVSDNFAEAFECAINKNSAVQQILANTETIVAGVARTKLEKQTLPADLAMDIDFSDEHSFSPNHTIDAREESTLSIDITNNGRGTAYGVELSVNCDNPGVRTDTMMPVGDIQPGGSKKITVPVASDLSMKSGIATFRIVARERRGYDSKTYNLKIPTIALKKPRLSIASYKINDGKIGLASGNGNGIPENGETIELIPCVRNDGVGRAIKVNLAIDSVNPGIDVVRRSAMIDEISPGQTVTGNLAFAIPRTYAGGDLQVKLLAADIRGAAEARKLLVLNAESRRPVLAYSYRVIDRNGDRVMENGEEGEIEITPINNGRMKARNVTLELSSAELEFSKNQDEVYSIDAESKYTPLRFPFKVPRTLEKKSVDVMVTLTQQDFSGLTDTINIPLKLMMPDLTITHQLLDANNNGVIEQGESVDLIVKVRNIGGLDAENVRLAFAFDRAGVVNMGQKAVDIGRIAAGRTSSAKIFNLNVSRRAVPGSFPVSFTLTQADFSAKTVPLALNIVEEKAEVIAIAGQKSPEKTVPVVVASEAKIAPMLFIHTPRNQKRVASRYEVLSGMAGDDKGVAGIEVRVNGERINASRGIGIVAAPGGDQKQRDFELKIPLVIGKNVIEVTAFDIENLSTAKTVTIYREAQKGELYVAVIGIDRYRYVPRLKYAVNDARSFAGYMRDNMGLDSEHLLELYDEQATERNIKSLLGTRLYKKADRPEDTIFIFFAGHGAPEKDPYSRDGDSIRKYILACDSDLQDLYSTGIPMDTIAELFRRYKAERVVFFADSCYSGGSGGRTVLASAVGWRAANISDKFLERIARAGKGRIIMTSSSAREVSQESDRLGHGYFTYYLIEGLKGAADISRDGEIDIDEVYHYLNQRVARATHGTQHPVKKGEAEGRVIIGRVRP